MSDFNDRNYVPSNYYDDVNTEEFFQNEKAADGEAGMQYRSLAFAPMNQDHAFRAFSDATSKDPSYRVDASPVVPQHTVDLKSSGGIGKRSSHIVPEPPFGLPRTKFEVSGGVVDLVQPQIDQYLNSLSDFDFSYLPEYHMWKGKFLNGACCIEMDIRLYQERGSDQMIVAVLKSKADARCGRFQSFFSEFQESITGSPLAKKARRGIPVGVLPSDFAVPTDEEFISGIEPVFKMAKEACMEPRLEAAKMMCDLSSKDLHFLELDAFHSDCVVVLETLVQDNFIDVKQHTIMAISKFAEIESYQEDIINSRILPVLFALVDNSPDNIPSWDTAQIRRSAAATIALLCRKHAGCVRANLQHLFPLDGWAERMVPAIRDCRTRTYAMAAAELLQSDVAVAYAQNSVASLTAADSLLSSELHSIVR